MPTLQRVNAVPLVLTDAARAKVLVDLDKAVQETSAEVVKQVDLHYQELISGIDLRVEEIVEETKELPALPVETRKAIEHGVAAAELDDGGHISERRRTFP